MKFDWFGDSYDIVKRFFVGQLRSLGYRVYVDPMPSGDWKPVEPAFLKFLGALHVRDARVSGQSALLLDPDKGIAKRRSHAHASISHIVGHLTQHMIVFVFDHSISRAAPPLPQLQAKLRQLKELGGQGFYYDSHARFLFASFSGEKLSAFREALLKAGLPEHRLVALDPHSD
jgi:hypothetical protein